MNNNSTEGGCGCWVSVILTGMVILASFGFIKWSTVGSTFRGLVYIAIVVVIGFIILFLYAKSKE